MIVYVDAVNIPAWSTIGYCEGEDASGDRVFFIADHRPARELGEALRLNGEPVLTTIEDWQLQ